MELDDIVDSLRDCFTSTNVKDRQGIAGANLVDVADRSARNLERIAHAISPDAIPFRTPAGGVVGTLTEAVIYAAESLTEIAEAIGDLASAVRERNSTGE